VCRVQMLS
jgi:hypothetical protein